MGGEEQEKKENSGYGERLREITAVLKKHAIPLLLFFFSVLH